MIKGIRSSLKLSSIPTESVGGIVRGRRALYSFLDLKRTFFDNQLGWRETKWVDSELFFSRFLSFLFFGASASS